MNEQLLLIGLIVLIVVGGIAGLVTSFRAFNSPDGERYRRVKMQGPFVPLSAQDIAEDELRTKARADM